MSEPPTGIHVVAPDGVPEVRAGDDLTDLLLSRVELTDGDVVVVTSKVVSKSEGRVRSGTREGALAGETERVVARRGPTTIVRTRHGLTLAAAGIDASNVTPGLVVLLPEDPDASARAIRTAVLERTGRNVGVVVTDTAGRAWREGQTDIAVGAAGLVVLESFAGRTDSHGNELAVTAPAVADEIAGVAELAQGKLRARPFAVLRGRSDLVLPPGDHGSGAAALVRPERADLFGYGAREAVLRAVAGDPAGLAAFGAAAGAHEVAAAVATVLPGVALLGADDGSLTLVAPDDSGVRAQVRMLLFAHGWLPDGTAGHPDRDTPGPGGLRFRAVNP